MNGTFYGCFNVAIFRSKVAVGEFLLCIWAAQCPVSLIKYLKKFLSSFFCKRQSTLLLETFTSHFCYVTCTICSFFFRLFGFWIVWKTICRSFCLHSWTMFKIDSKDHFLNFLPKDQVWTIPKSRWSKISYMF